MTKDQEDTRRWLEQTFRYFDRTATVTLMKVSKSNGHAICGATSAGRGVQVIEIHPNGKPAWDGETNPS